MKLIASIMVILSVTDTTRMELGRIHLSLGEVEKAQAHAEKALGSARNYNSKLFEGVVWTWLGHILGKKEHPQFNRAQEYILKGIKMGEDLKLKPLYSQGYLVLGELYADMGRQDEARKNLKKAEENFLEMGMDYDLDKTQRLLERIL